MDAKCKGICMQNMPCHYCVINLDLEIRPEIGKRDKWICIPLEFFLEFLGNLAKSWWTSMSAVAWVSFTTTRLCKIFFPDLNFETTVLTLKCNQNSISCKILCTPNLLLCPSYFYSWSRKLRKVYHVKWNLILMPALHFKVRTDM